MSECMETWPLVEVQHAILCTCTKFCYLRIHTAGQETFVIWGQSFGISKLYLMCI